MDDLDIDRELRAALSVTPSPEFVARVRTKIADAPRPSILAGWLKPTAAIACVVVAAIAVGLRRDAVPVTAGLKPSTTNVTPSTAYGSSSGARVAPSSTVAVPTFSPAVALAKAGRSAGSATATEPPLPEVIIAAEDVEALRQFVSSARDLRFVASFDETPASSPWVMNDLTVPPITIEPLNPAPAYND